MTEYFILSRIPSNKVNDSTGDKLINLTGKYNFILPYNNFIHYNNNGLYENNLIEWCKQYGDNTKIFLDIGAHTGTYTINLANYFKTTIAFEPQRITYYALCGSVALSYDSHSNNNIYCLNMGLGSADQVGNEVKLNIISEDGGGSTIQHIFPTQYNYYKTESIQIVTLDSLYDKYDLKNIGFIKMDVEGNELDVLKGATITLQNANYPKILFESNNGTKNIELFSYLSQLGYKTTSIIGYPNMFLAFT